MLIFRLFELRKSTQSVKQNFGFTFSHQFWTRGCFWGARRIGGKVIKRSCLLALLLVLSYWGVVLAQHPVLDMITNKVIQKYQQSSCEQLTQQKRQKQDQPRSTQEQEALKILHADPQLRAEFLNKVSGPIANKMFECGMIP
jgi:hypothetical protein